MTNPCFMGPLGVGSWHEWPRDRLVALLSGVWYDISRSQHLQRNVLSVSKSDCEALPRGDVWKTKFIKPSETPLMVVWEGAVLLNDHWEELKWVFCTWAADNMLATPFNKYWLQGALLLTDPAIRVHALVAKEGVGQPRLIIMGIPLALWEGWLLRGA